MYPAVIFALKQLPNFGFLYLAPETADGADGLALLLATPAAPENETWSALDL